MRDGRGRSEVFYDASEFLVRVSPEMLRAFTLLECRVDGPLRITWALRRPITWRRGQSICRLNVVVNDDVARTDALSAARTLIVEIGRGYQPLWGASRWPAEVVARTVVDRHGYHLRRLLLVAVAVVLGVGLGLTARRLFDDAVPLWASVLVLAGAFVPSVVAAAIPNVEVAALGRTRARVLAGRLAASTAAAATSPLLAYLLGR